MAKDLNFPRIIEHLRVWAVNSCCTDVMYQLVLLDEVDATNTRHFTESSD